jgi:hypothetical protein
MVCPFPLCPPDGSTRRGKRIVSYFLPSGYGATVAFGRAKPTLEGVFQEVYTFAQT